VPGGVISVGTITKDDDNEFRYGMVSLFGVTDTVMAETSYRADSVNVSLNDIASFSDSSYLVAGARTEDDITGVFVATVTLTGSGELIKNGEVEIIEIMDSFHNVVVDPSETTSQRLVCYGLSGAYTKPKTLVAYKLILTLPGLAPYSIEWSRKLALFPGVAINGASYGDAMIFFNRTLLVIGNTDDPQKEPHPGNGLYWESGAVAALSEDGDVKWLKKVAATGYSDRFMAIASTADAVYAVGCSANAVSAASKVGNAWVAQISHDSGDMISYMTFGNRAYKSWFGGVVAGRDAIYCAGGTQSYTTTDGCRGWFCEIDIVDPPPLLELTDPDSSGAQAADHAEKPVRFFDIGRPIARDDP
jgi:hypothetical protein